MNARAGIELAVDALTIRFGGLTAVDGATFEVRTGEVLSLIGPNGAGKTTAFNAITGFIELTGGHIAYRGQRLDGLKPNQIAALGVVRTFQKTSVFTGRSVHDNVAIGLHLRSRQTPLAILLGLPSVAREEKELAKEASQILRFVGLEARADQPASSLPYGELRLLEVAVALAAQPKLLLLDEPVSGMNPVETDSFMKLLAQIRGTGHHRAARRARHEDGDGRVRPHRLPQPRPRHRYRLAGRDPAQPGGGARLSRGKVRPCSRLRA